jgi:UDP-4-amino-4,6-dideoxy-N-acetyl-beta-L-altrosamine N-acetyltransferase
MPLRKIQQEDLELMLSWRNHPSVRSSMFSQSVIELDQHSAWFRRESKKETSLWLLYLDTEKNPAGVVYFTEMDSVSSNAFWGFYAAPGAKPGTGTRMGVEALNYFFFEKGFHKVIADVLDTNQRSHRFHRKLGFRVEEGICGQHLRKKGYQNVTRFGLLKSGWADNRKILENI